MRRPRSPDDPTPRRVLGFEGRAILYAVLDTLAEREAGVMALRFGLTDGQPKSWDDIAHLYGITSNMVKVIERKVLSKLRDQRRSGALGVWDRGLRVDSVNTPSYASSLAAAIPVVPCSQCQEVPLIIHDEISKGGRPRKYCSARCRQAAYRARRTAGGEQRSL